MIIETAITGTRPLIVHDVFKLANPLSQDSKLIKTFTGKRNKTDADLLEIARLEWNAGLYYNDQLGPIMPSRCLAAMIRSAAKKKKMGKVVQESVVVLSDVPIKYDGPRDKVEMWKSELFAISVPAKVNGNIVMRTRPMFENWSLDFEIDVDEDQLNPTELNEFLQIAGKRIGLCDWRPVYGRFTVDRFEQARLAA